MLYALLILVSSSSVNVTLCATAQEALDAGEERVVELNKMTFEQQSKELW
jgi:hypothetical protein